jgi:hypothetical protein
VILETLGVFLQNGSEDLGFDRYVTVDRWLDLIWAVGFDLAVVVACKWIGSRGLPSKRRRRGAGSGRPAGQLAGVGQQGAPVRQIHKQTHGEEEEETGNLTRGSEGRGKHRRQWPSGGGERWRRCSAAAALWRGRRGREGAGWRGGHDAPL